MHGEKRTAIMPTMFTCRGCHGFDSARVRHTRALLAAVFLLMMYVPGQASDPRSWAVGERQAYTPEEIQQGALDSYFTGAVFAGDSVTNQLRRYTYTQRKQEGAFLSDAQFQCAVNYSLYTASLYKPQPGKVNLIYKGQDQSLLQAVRRLQPARLFVLLGANDYAPQRAEKALAWYKTLITRVKEVSPDTDIVVQALPPVSRSLSSKQDMRPLWDAFNQQLQELCQQEGVAFADIATPLKDDEGYLQPEYASKDGLHLSAQGLLAWVNALRDNAHERYLHDQWTP